ncbi:MAG: Ldh family oxidoreductase [Chloroflexi bacterium]|nr:Ldh family oxidoreductase [Chloroflexota bacterium]MCC6893858.1 Ldh family oxidoreductase [Anaerolineae bacterium]
MSTVRVFAKDLEAFVIEAMRRYGIHEDDAQLSAQILVTTDTWGVHTHGTRQLRPLLKNFPIGRLNADAKPEMIREGAAWTLLDGHHGVPFVTAHHAMKLAIEKAKICGIGYTGVIHTSHFGAAGYYATMAAEQGMVGIASCNADPQMTVPGGRGKVLGTNPIAYAVPAGSNKPVFLDIATSAAAANKIIRAKLLGQSIPEGWLVNADGEPTTDPSGFPETGALMPMAAHKGYGFALLVEVLAGAMTGAAMTKEQPSWVTGVAGNPPGPANQGQMFIAIDTSAMLPPERFGERMDWLLDYIHDAPKAKGSERIYLPGEIEWEKREHALEHGMILPPDVVESLQGLAGDVGIETLPFETITDIESE